MDFYDLGSLFVGKQKRQEQLKETDREYWEILSLYQNESANEGISKIALHPVGRKGVFEVSKTKQLFYVFSGQCDVIVEDKKVTLLPGNILYLAVEKIYKIAQIDSGTMLVKVEFGSLKKLQDFFSEPVLNEIKEKDNPYKQVINFGYVLFGVNKKDDPSYLIERLITEQITNSKYSKLIVELNLKICLVELLKGHYLVSPEQYTKKTKYQKEDFLDYIDIHFQKADLHKMALFFGYNPNYLSNTLKKTTGKSFMELIQIKKLNVAASLLANPQISIEEIINYLGYSSSSFFYRKFKEFYQISPGQMRNKLWKEE